MLDSAEECDQQILVTHASPQQSDIFVTGQICNKTYNATMKKIIV